MKITSRFKAGQRFAYPWLMVFNSIFSTASHAENDANSEQAFLQDFPVVLSASRLSQPLSEAPNAMTVIDRNMIKASGFRTISDVFRLVPGMYVGNLSGHTPVVGYHGSTEEFSRRMQVLVDGRSVYLPPLSTVDWEDIPLHIEDIERIEVVRGPAAASYGANSLQGVINIITRDAASISGNALSLAYGSEGVADLAAHLGGGSDNLDYRLTFAHREDTGYGSNVMNDAKSTNQANVRANFHPVGADSFDFQLGLSHSKRGLGIATKSDEVFRDAKVISSFQQLNWLHAMQNGDELKVSYFHINRNYTDEKSNSLNAGGFVSAKTLADRQDIELQQTLQLGKNNRLVWGSGVRQDYTDSPEQLVVPYMIYQKRFFAHDEWRFVPSTLLNIGAMIEDDGLGHTNTSPRLSLNYHLTPQHTFRASTSVAYRTPALFEEKANIHGSTIPEGTYVSRGGLKPEKTLSRELGYLGEFHTLGLSFDARIYNDQISDMIFVDPSMSATTWPYGFANLFSANYSGYEATLKYHWRDHSSVVVNYARQFLSCAITGEATFPALLPIFQGYIDECPLAVPYNSGSILLTQQLNQEIQISAAYYYQEKIKMIAATPQSEVNRVDLRLAKSFGRTGKMGSGEISLLIQNAFQDNYTKYSVVNETKNIYFGRRAFVGATLNF